MSVQAHHSHTDASVNFVTQGDFPGLIEARYVRRQADYFIVYLSSQSGCAMRCQMCHLTQTQQLAHVDMSQDDYVTQATRVFTHYDHTGEPARIVHFNYMSRGEVFANHSVLDSADELINRLNGLALSRGLIPIHKFSTIMPRQTMIKRTFTDIFRAYQPDIYYSLYSLNPDFRSRWLPNAIDPYLALEKLRAWQETSHKLPVLHWAFIANENDDATSMHSIARAINAFDLRVDFNIVRYNPFGAVNGVESSEPIILRNAELLRNLVPGSRVQIVKRVGFDVKASCGMFVSNDNAQ
jgi:23S rRNA (adenine2503-C2)-methyltransferase